MSRDGQVYDFNGSIQFNDYGVAIFDSVILYSDLRVGVSVNSLYMGI
jgi:hypothetical protein